MLGRFHLSFSQKLLNSKCLAYLISSSTSFISYSSTNISIAFISFSSTDISTSFKAYTSNAFRSSFSCSSNSHNFDCSYTIYSFELLSVYTRQPTLKHWHWHCFSAFTLELALISFTSTSTDRFSSPIYQLHSDWHFNSFQCLNWIFKSVQHFYFNFTQCLHLNWRFSFI